MANLTPQQIAQYAEQAGFTGWNLVTAVAVALAESSANPGAINHGTPGNPENSQGLWQINLDAHPQYVGTNILDPLTNAQAAYAVSGSGSNWSPWSTYTNGAYKTYLNQAIAAVASIVPGQVFSSFSSTATGVAGQGGGPLIGTPSINLPTINIPGASDIANAVTNAGQGAVNAIQQAIVPVASLFSNLTSLIQFGGNPNVWVGIAMVGIGILVSLVGVVLFGISLIPHSAQSNTLRAATAIA